MTYTESTQVDVGRQARLGPNHGYRIAGDLACLNAELALDLVPQQAFAQNWALQLWACDQPYQGGALRGTKIAEAPVELADLGVAQPQNLYAETFARLPAGDRDYSMVLVLASRADDTREQVLDFANYPAREHFSVPTLRGEVTYAIDSGESGEVTLRAERIDNPRGVENLSGSLALELWELDEPYQGGQFSGAPLAGVELGRLAGQSSFGPVDQRLPAVGPRKRKHLTVMLREWTATGYVTRDYRSFVAPVDSVAPVAPVDTAPVVMTAQPAPQPSPVVSAPAPQSVQIVAHPPVAEPSAAPSPAAAQKPDAPNTDRATHMAKTADVPSTSALVSIQHATLDELAAVPGVNRKLAQEIIKARPFRTFEQLTRVRGIGDKTVRKLRAVLTL